jgi:hypothetical protein
LQAVAVQTNNKGDGIMRNGKVDDPGIGHNLSKEQRLRELERAIRDYILDTRATAQSAPSKVLGSLSSGDRLVALRNFTLLASVRYVRRTPRADVVIALIPWLAAMADNTAATSRVSLARLGRLLNRRVDVVGEGLRRLVGAGGFGGQGSKTEGVATRVWPIIEPLMMEAKPFEILEAVAPSTRPDDRPLTDEERRELLSIRPETMKAFADHLLKSGEAKDPQQAEFMAEVYLDDAMSEMTKMALLRIASQKEAPFDSAFSAEEVRRGTMFAEQQFQSLVADLKQLPFVTVGDGHAELQDGCTDAGAAKFYELIGGVWADVAPSMGLACRTRMDEIWHHLGMSKSAIERRCAELRV